MHSFQNFIVRLIPNHPPPLETRIWKLVVRPLVVDLTVELTDLATEITKYANLRTHTRKIINNYFKYTNTRCNAIEYRSFYLVVLFILAGSSRF